MNLSHGTRGWLQRREVPCRSSGGTLGRNSVNSTPSLQLGEIDEEAVVVEHLREGVHKHIHISRDLRHCPCRAASLTRRSCISRLGVIRGWLVHQPESKCRLLENGMRVEEQMAEKGPVR